MFQKFYYTLAINFQPLILKDNFFNNAYTKGHKWFIYIDDLSLGSHQNVTPITPDELQ